MQRTAACSCVCAPPARHRTWPQRSQRPRRRSAAGSHRAPAPRRPRARPGSAAPAPPPPGSARRLRVRATLPRTCRGCRWQRMTAAAAARRTTPCDRRATRSAGICESSSAASYSAGNARRVARPSQAARRRRRSTCTGRRSSRRGRSRPRVPQVAAARSARGTRTSACRRLAPQTPLPASRCREPLPAVQAQPPPGRRGESRARRICSHRFRPTPSERRGSTMRAH
mmetsp:Transcript_43291/g.114491  ORF Transcript_43291/g.114491 Transcript_43291/m.114491 type:complete len:227 (-) Transcript_43291:49-729(-)